MWSMVFLGIQVRKQIHLLQTQWIQNVYLQHHSHQLSFNTRRTWLSSPLLFFLPPLVLEGTLLGKVAEVIRDWICFLSPNKQWQSNIVVVVYILYWPPLLVSHATASSCAECSLDKTPASFVSGQESTMWNIVCGSPQAHRSESTCRRLFRQAPQWKAFRAMITNSPQHWPQDHQLTSTMTPRSPTHLNTGPKITNSCQQWPQDHQLTSTLTPRSPTHLNTDPKITNLPQHWPQDHQLTSTLTISLASKEALLPFNASNSFIFKLLWHFINVFNKLLTLYRLSITSYILTYCAYNNITQVMYLHCDLQWDSFVGKHTRRTDILLQQSLVFLSYLR